MSAPSKPQYDVVIVGLGPTGATLAHLLALRGISTLVLERESHIYPLPRAVHFDDETMRVFQTIGIADDLFKKIRINPGMRFVDADQNLLLDWPRPANISPQGWHPSYRFHQPDLEHLLRQALVTRTEVTTLLGCKVTGITAVAGDTPDSGHCVVDYNNQQQPQQVTSRYVVGCDGANSTVGDAMGTASIDLGFRERWLVVDLMLHTDKPELGDSTVQHCNPTRPSTYVRCPENRRRWEFALNDTETDVEIQDDHTLWSLLQPWLKPHEASLERSAVYTFRSTLAETWYANQLCLAGDAAHLTPPFMGQGMCCGIRDAANLAWKLAHCIQRGHSEELMQSYGCERSPHMRVYLETAMKLGGLINTCATEDALRSALLNPDGSAKMKSISPQLGPGLSKDLHTELTHHSGLLFPQPELADKRRIDDVVGYQFVLLTAAGWCPALTKQQQDLRVITDEDSPGLAQLLSQWHSHAILIRPDRYVWGTANTEAELTLLLDSYAVFNSRDKNAVH